MVAKSLTRQMETPDGDKAAEGARLSILCGPYHLTGAAAADAGPI